MKKIKNFIPLNKNNRNIFINDVIEAFISFLMGNVIEAIFDLKIIKMVVFIICYIIFFIIRSWCKNIKDKGNSKYRGIKEIKIISLRNIFERGL